MTGIEKDTEHGYMDIARARIEYAEKRLALGYTTFEDQAPLVARSDTKATQVTTQIDMFEGLL